MAESEESELLLFIAGRTLGVGAGHLLRDFALYA